jgi:TolB-like protein/DNA-binding winged helix-turn-helix (wHTH) protein
MDISLTDKGLYAFGSFTLDPLKRVLLRDGVPVPLSPKVFDTLLYLVEHADRLLDKDELLDAVWPGRVVEENNLTHNISILRKAFSRDGTLDRCIVTSPGRGYRFTAALRRVPRAAYPGETTAPADGGAVQIAGDGNPAPPPAASPRRWRRMAWAAAFVLLPLTAVLIYLATARFAHAPATRASVAVLPFENLSNDKNNEYFVAGVQDLILTKLADIGGLKVVSGTSTRNYPSRPDDLETVARQLGVATILEGSVQKDGNQVLINVQLIDASTDSHIWAGAFTRTLDNIFGVEGEVAEQVAAELQAKLSPAESASLAAMPTRNEAAYDLFLHAEYLFNKGIIDIDFTSLKSAIPLYRQAVEHDPDFALAWARLSFNESLLAWFGGGGEDVMQLVRLARADAERAVQLQPDLSTAYLAVGYSDYYGHRDYAAALKAFAEALTLKPNDVDALAAQGYVERRLGRFGDAIASLQQALSLDPRNSALVQQLGMAYLFAGRYPDAEKAFQRALALDPDDHYARIWYAQAIELGTGDIPRALAAVQGNDPALKGVRVTLLTDARKYREALELLNTIPDTVDNFNAGSKALIQANLYRLMGDSIHARPLYEQALSHARAQLDVRQGTEFSNAWGVVAAAELGIGHTKAGLAAIAMAQAIAGKVKDQVTGSDSKLDIAQLYAEARRPDLAVPVLTQALAMPGIGAYYSPMWLWLDPVWDPIRGDPRFQALLKQYGQYRPVLANASSPSDTNKR